MFHIRFYNLFRLFHLDTFSLCPLYIVFTLSWFSLFTFCRGDDISPFSPFHSFDTWPFHRVYLFTLSPFHLITFSQFSHFHGFDFSPFHRFHLFTFSPFFFFQQGLPEHWSAVDKFYNLFIRFHLITFSRCPLYTAFTLSWFSLFTFFQADNRIVIISQFSPFHDFTLLNRLHLLYSGVTTGWNRMKPEQIRRYTLEMIFNLWFAVTRFHRFTVFTLSPFSPFHPFEPFSPLHSFHLSRSTPEWRPDQTGWSRTKSGDTD